ncbi:MAG: lysine transporter LysE [Rhodospirillaceae bacterium]|nr:MAG: lysine transporter LysE [Rhodospirillaceae bacterium]
MNFTTTLGLTFATLAFVLSPGPANIAVLITSARDGFMAGFFLAIGEVIGALIYLIIAMFSLAVLSSAIEPVMIYVKFGGAMYLVYLGYMQFISNSALKDEARQRRSPLNQMLVGLLINGSNPKLVLFYLSFLPLFIDLNTLTLPVGIQIVFIIGSTLLAGISVVCGLGQQLSRLMRHTKMAQRVNRISGVMMIGVGISVARS